MVFDFWVLASFSHQPDLSRFCGTTLPPTDKELPVRTAAKGVIGLGDKDKKDGGRINGQLQRLTLAFLNCDTLKHHHFISFININELLYDLFSLIIVL